MGSKKAFLNCGYLTEGELRKQVNLDDMNTNSFLLGLVKGEVKKPWQELNETQTAV